jgi:hypothetical protein
MSKSEEKVLNHLTKPEVSNKAAKDAIIGQGLFSTK